MAPDIAIRPLHECPRGEWEILYRAYADFYRVPMTPAMLERVWGWLADPGHEVRGFAALREGRVAGIAHFRTFARPLNGSTGLYLDDLFVAPGQRGGGIGATLIEAIAATARAEGRSVVRWMTAADNARAQRLYDHVARRTAWVTYEKAP